MNNNPKTYSLKKRIYTIICTVFALLLVVLLGYSAFFAKTLATTTEEEMRQTLSLYNRQVSESLKKIDYYMIKTANSDTDITYLAAQTKLDTSYLNITRSIINFQNTLSLMDRVKGLCAYFPRTDCFVYSDTYPSESSYPFSVYLRKEIRENPAFMDKLCNSDGNWTLLEYGDKWYLAHFYQQNTSSYLGAWTDTETLSDSLTELKEKGSLIFLTSENGFSAGEMEDEKINIALDKTLNHGSYIRYNGIRYLAISEKLSYCNYSLTCLIPDTNINNQLYVVLRVLVLISLCLLAGCFFLVKLLQQMITHPLKLLQETSSAISEGNTQQRINTASIRSEEVLKISESFNSMIDTIEKLKIDVYEETLQKKDVEMHYLQSQVSPHFFINCLNLINFLADGTKENAKTIHILNQSLALHLRYTLKSKKAVSLEEEIRYEHNYIKMTELRFPGCLDCCFEISEKAQTATVFPLILMMFTENAFKYNLIMGEVLQIIIRAEIIQRSGELYLHLTHIDSGDGYSDEILEFYSNLDSQKKPSDNTGNHIGIYNIIRRVQLFYNDKASIVFSNEPGMGARIDITVPYIEFEPEEKGS